MNKCLIIFAIALICFSQSKAQYSLDEVIVHDNTDTRLLDVNNKGMICGYYIHHTTSNEVGFVINDAGRIHNFFAPVGYTHTRVVSINDRDTPTILIRASNSIALNADADVFKSYYFPKGDSFSQWQQITLSVTNGYPTRVNNNNHMLGWYAQGSSINSARYFWLYFDSLQTKPANHSSQYYATRYTKPPAAPQPTFGSGINDNGIMCGYYYDLNNQTYTSFVFDINTNAFTIFNNFSGRQLYDINNSGFVVGRLISGSNERAFMGTYSGTTLTSILIPIFSQSMESEFTGVNDDTVIVGNYKHPTSGRWIGFVYRRNVSEFKLPGFIFNRHTWKMRNNHDYSASPNDTDIWTNKYFGSPNYGNYDIYANQSVKISKDIWPDGWQLADKSSYTWLGFCQEIDEYQYGPNANNSNNDSLNYQVTHRPLMFEKYTIYTADGEGKHLTEIINNDSFAYGSFGGYCYGFSYTVLQKLYDSTTYKNWFNVTQNKDAADYNNSDTQAINTIERTMIKQLDGNVYSQHGAPNFRKVPMWTGLYRLKNEFRKSHSEINPRTISFKITNNGWHSTMPYKIKTPLTLPIDNQRDTVFIYDSNIPNDSNQYFLVKGNMSIFNTNHDSFSNAYYTSGVTSINFNKPGVKDLPEFYGHKKHSNLKPNGINDDEPFYTFAINGSEDYTLKNNGNDSAYFVGDEFENNIEELTPKIPYNKKPIPFAYMSDTANAFSLKANVDNSYPFTKWTIINNTYAMGILRPTSNNTETDYGVFKNKYIAYGSKDNATKVMTLSYIQADYFDEFGVNYKIKNFVVKQDDSFITSSPEDYWYKIVRIGGDSTEYDISLQILDNGNLRTLNTTIGINGNSTHVYDPYYNGPQGNQLVIFVDEGNTGTYNDTLFLDPINIKEQFKNATYVSVYPNPVNDYLSIELSNHFNAAYELNITDITGKQIMKESINLRSGKASISLSNLSSGLYIVQIKKDGDNIYREKVFKK